MNRGWSRPKRDKKNKIKLTRNPIHTHTHTPPHHPFPVCILPVHPVLANQPSENTTLLILTEKVSFK